MNTHYIPDNVTLSTEHEDGAWYLKQFYTGISLPPRQEQAVFARLRNGDITEKELLVNAYLPLVARLSSRYLDRGLPLADLLQEGALGLLQAIEDFDPVRAVPFRVFARRRIRWAMHAATRKSRYGIKLPSALQEQIDTVNHLTFQLFQTYGSAVLDEVTTCLAGLSSEDIHQLELVTEPPLSLDSLCSLPQADSTTDDEESAVSETWGDHLTAPVSVEEDLLQAEEQEILLQALQELSDTQRSVLAQHFGLLGHSESTIEEVGQAEGITSTCVTHRKSQALRKLRAGSSRIYASRHPAIRSLYNLQKEGKRT